MFFSRADVLLLLGALLDLVLETLNNLLDGELSFSRIDVVLNEVAFDGLLSQGGSEGVEHLAEGEKTVAISKASISNERMLREMASQLEVPSN